MNFNDVTYEMSAGVSKQLPASIMPEIVFSGRSNVGKSSLLNKILNRKNLARVSSKPGKTITINFYKADGARLVDLPGYGYAKQSFAERKRWSQMIEDYFNSNRQIRLVVQLIDMRHNPTQDDIQMLDFLYQTENPYIVALTKSDKLKKMEYEKQLELLTKIIAPFEPLAIIPFSAVKGEGVKDVRQYITYAVQRITPDTTSSLQEIQEEENEKQPFQVKVTKKNKKA
ncbi:MAG: YihA family ribosome biogenesis GTP-binding protein [Ruminococcaceae bacterium]|mgnify:CR=1 FL=1|nr:YihA family ribosome biogenesis GTP-binding protein [Oscillospiraceae bacterium]